MRNPSVHVTKTDLETVLKSYGITKWEIEDIVSECRKYALKGRVTVKAKTRTKKKAERLVASSDGLTERFNGVLSKHRIALNHKFSTVRKSSKEWLMMTEVASLAMDFCKLFQLDKDIEAGFSKYIVCGLALMGKSYGLNKFKFYNQRIIDYYEFSEAIDTDVRKEATADFYNVYCDTILENTGVDLELTNVEDYVHMVFGRQEADEAGADYQDWIDAQFDGLSFMNAVPDLPQLYGKNAQKRYRAYTHKQGFKNKRPDGLPDKYLTEAEEKYWRTIREKRAE